MTLFASYNLLNGSQPAPIVKSRLRGILAVQSFHVTVLSPNLLLNEVTGVYNRINTAGKEGRS